jgi:hypothetical protein
MLGTVEDDDHARHDDRSLRELDDLADREELRRRYYGLLQELRVIIPGVQVLLAFLLTAPFADRFADLDDRGRTLYGVALLAAFTSVTSLMTPTVMHRLGDRQARRVRLQWSIRLTVVGLLALAVSLLSATWCVARHVYGPDTASEAAGAAAALVVLLWIALPLLLARR